MSQTKKNVISIILFILIFGGLLTVATFYDLEISKILTNGNLLSGEYYAVDTMGLIVEYIGSFPIFVFGIFACLVFIRKLRDFKWYGKILQFILFLVMVFVCEMLIGDTLKYYSRVHDMEAFYEATSTTIVLYAISLLICIFLWVCYRNTNDEKNERYFTFAGVILITCIGYYITVNVIKSPMGRMRFRGMNLINDFSYYTPWYMVSDAKHQLVEMNQSLGDAFKSFPSGHTYSAGVSYVLICMPFVNRKYDTPGWRRFWYILPIFYTGLVGFYRIVVGAHFMSDVLVGGTLAFLFASITKYFVYTRKEIQKTY